MDRGRVHASDKGPMCTSVIEDLMGGVELVGRLAVAMEMGKGRVWLDGEDFPCVCGCPLKEGCGQARDAEERVGKGASRHLNECGAS